VLDLHVGKSKGLSNGWPQVQYYVVISPGMFPSNASVVCPKRGITTVDFYQFGISGFRSGSSDCQAQMGMKGAQTDRLTNASNEIPCQMNGSVRQHSLIRFGFLNEIEGVWDRDQSVTPSWRDPRVWTRGAR
jgi:hypothetical protein